MPNLVDVSVIKLGQQRCMKTLLLFPRGSRSLLSESWGAAKVTLDVTGL